jgi:hypothetical protein
LPTGIAPPDGSIITAPSFDVTVTANTNLKWWVQVDDGAKNETPNPDTYKTGDTREVTVPARSTRAIPSWISNGTVNVKAGYDTQNSIAAATPGNYSFTRLPYKLDVTGVATSNSVTLNVDTDADEYSLVLKANDIDGDPLVTTNYTSGTPKTYELSTTTTARPVVIINAVTGLPVGEFTQPARRLYETLAGLLNTMALNGDENGPRDYNCPEGYTKFGGVLEVGDGWVINTAGKAGVHSSRMYLMNWTAYGYDIYRVDSYRGITGMEGIISEVSYLTTVAWGATKNYFAGLMLCVN